MMHLKIRGFIDFIVEPTFTVLTDMTEKAVTPLIDEASRSGLAGFRRSSLNSITPSDVKRTSVKNPGSEGSASLNCSLLTVDFKNFKASWNETVQQNREKWKTQATKDAEEKARREAEEKVRQEAEEKEERDKAGIGLQEQGPEQSTEKSADDSEKSNVNGTQGHCTSTHSEPEEKESDVVSDKEAEHTSSQVQNVRHPAYDLIRYFKRPSYCANSYLSSVQKKAEESLIKSKNLDQRGKMKKLQCISLRGCKR